MEDLFLGVGERGGAVLLLILGRDAVHERLERKAVFPFQCRVATSAQICPRRRHVLLGPLSSVFILILPIIVTSRRLSLRELIGADSLGRVGEDDVLV